MTGRACFQMCVVASAALLVFSASAQQSAAASEPVVSIAALNGAMVAGSDTRTIQGIVTHTGIPLVVQDATGATEVEATASAPSLRLGDELQVTGIVRRNLFGSSFSHATVRLLGPSVPYPPLSITPSMAASGRYQRRFITTDGLLLATSYERHRPELLFERGNQRFVAELPASVSPEVLRHLQTGSTLRVRGVCLMAGESSGNTPFTLVPFRVLMRAQDDIEQIAAPPFWTRTHILWLCALLMLCAYLGHVFYLRLERWRFHLILQERARVAHDLHDTLAQSFAGINFQLEALRKASGPFYEDIQDYLDLAISMVSHSHEDARRAIAMLRPAELDTGNLIDNLRLQGEQLTHGGSLTFQVETEGDPVALPRKAEQLLLRIGHEAITNAISHAAATRIAIRLRYLSRDVQLSITDDGAGLPSGQPTDRDGLPLNGYGIAGMRARARAAGGSFRLSSKDGVGTTVDICLPVSRAASRTQTSLLWRLRAWWLGV